MSNRAELLKSIIKGTNDITEDAALDKYLLSRGINPKFATKDQKVSHSKTGQFIKWKQDHMKDLGESVDKKDTVTLDIPLLIRVLELAREDIKTDMDLHRVVEKLINIRNKGMLTMKDYNYIAKIHEFVVYSVSTEVIEEAMRTPKDEKEWEKVAQARSEVWRRKQLKKIDENHIAVAMGKELDDEGSMVMNQLDQMERSINMLRDVVKDPKMQLPGWVQSKVTLAADYIETVAGYMSSKNEEVEQVDEVDMSKTLAAYNKGKPEYAQAKIDTRTAAERKADTDKMLAARKKPTPTPSPVKTKPVSMDDIHKQIAKSYAQHKPGQYVGDSVEHDDESIIEARQSAEVRWQKALQDEKKKREEQEKRNAENAKRALAPKPVQESDCGCSDVPPEDKDKKLIQMSKSARIIKSIYKKKGMSEDTYDWEKEDKSVATYGKKPKLSKTNPDKSVGENKPDAAAIMTGGKTLTGQDRDTVEIDPMMRKRPGPNVPGKNK